jgi:hypothetical protein
MFHNVYRKAVNMALSEEERKELYKDYERVFDYEPSEEEVKKRYSKEFNDWIDNKKV